MALDGTSFATGLLGSVTAQNENAQKLQNEGDAEQFRTFQQAAKEYDSAKAKASDEQSKIDALANVLSSGKPNPAAYSTARDAVELGYTSEEHIPYVQQAYQATYKDMVANPDKWNVQPQQAKQLTQDSNPNQTNILRRFGDKDNIGTIENIRQHNITRPYNNFPGANFGDPEKIIADQTYNRAKATAQAQQDVQNIALARAGYGPDGNPLGSSAAPAATSQAGSAPTSNPMADDATKNPAAIPVSQLQIPSTPSGPTNAPAPTGTNSATPDASGIHINASAPPIAPIQQDNTATTATPSLRNEKYLAALPKSEQNIIRGMSDGNISMPSQYALARDKSGVMQARLNALLNYDTSANEKRMGQVGALKTGKQGDDIRQLNTTIGHLGALNDASKLLQNGNIQSLNKVANYLGVQAGDTPATTYNLIAQRVAQETTKLYTRGNTSVQEAQEAEKNIGNFQSPQQAHAAIQAQVGLMRSLMDGYENQWRGIMENAYQPHSFLSPTASKTWASMQQENDQSKPTLQQKAPTANTKEGIDALAKTGANQIQTNIPDGNGGFILLRRKQ